MMIKANGEYLDFDGDVEIESQIKLFEEISTSNGEFSYDIQIQDNGHNRKILGIPRADTIKTIYGEVVSEIIDDTGQSIYKGKLQVNNISGGIITSTFYAGNTEWFAMLSDPISKLPLYRYDVDLTEANIMASWLNDSGIVFPIVDAGVMVTRSFKNLKVEDFVSCFYVKTLFNEIFNPKGIKLQGDLIDDPTFNKLVVASNARSQDDIRNRSSYVNKTTAQTNVNNVVVTFDDDSTYPFFDGSNNLYDTVTSIYTPDVKMRVKVTLTLFVKAVAGAPNISLFTIDQRISGAYYDRYVVSVSATGSTLVREIEIPLDALDQYYVSVEVQAFNNISVMSGSIRITPVFLYKVSGVSSAPNWTQGEFVSNILRLFNVLPSYNTSNKTLTLDLFNKIKEKESVDISDQIVIDSVDYSELVSNYAKNNYFSYQESDDEDLREYNISNFISYGSGNLTIDNAYIDDSFNIIDSDFTTPITYLNGVFDMSMDRIHFVEYEEIEELDITNVGDLAGEPSFDIANADDHFVVGDVVRIDTGIDSYNGEFVINQVGSGFITVVGLLYAGTSTGTATLLRHQFTTDDSVYLFINVPNVPVSFFSSNSEFYLEDNTTFNTAAIAYFNLLSNNTNINRVYKQSLAFGAPNNVFNYQITLLETYWPLFSRMLRNPVKLLGSEYLKRTTFDNIKSFLKPVMIKTEETTNLYYLNRNRGYKGSERACELELIKIN